MNIKSKKIVKKISITMLIAILIIGILVGASIIHKKGIYLQRWGIIVPSHNIIYSSYNKGWQGEGDTFAIYQLKNNKDKWFENFTAGGAVFADSTLKNESQNEMEKQLIEALNNNKIPEHKKPNFASVYRWAKIGEDNTLIIVFVYETNLLYIYELIK